MKLKCDIFSAFDAFGSERQSVKDLASHRLTFQTRSSLNQRAGFLFFECSVWFSCLAERFEALDNEDHALPSRNTTHVSKVIRPSGELISTSRRFDAEHRIKIKAVKQSVELGHGLESVYCINDDKKDDAMATPSPNEQAYGIGRPVGVGGSGRDCQGTGCRVF